MCVHQYHKIETYFIFGQCEEKNLSLFTKNYSTFYPFYPGFGKTYSGSRMGQKGTGSRIRNTAVLVVPDRASLYDGAVLGNFYVRYW
jgi:hypothetical protein